jgi:REP element-mobilizing transposase RayT
MQQSLLEWRRHGGWRPGAGRKRTSRRVPHASRATARNGVYHITARIRSGLPSLRMTRVVRRIEQSFRRGRERADFRLVHYSLQRDHLHLIVEAAGGGSLARGVRALLIRVSKCANAAWGRRGCVVADRYHHRRLTTPREARNAIAYVLKNARKHLGEIARDRIDPASSGRWFWERASDAPAVAAPRFWLLRVGWLRYGPIPYGSTG